MDERDLEMLVAFLKDNLSVSIEQNTEFGPVEQVSIKLELCGEIVSESSCSLPNQES